MDRLVSLPAAANASLPTTPQPATPRPTTAAQASSTSPAPLDNFGVVPWLDTRTGETGHDPRSAYVETFWLPLLGPSTTLLIRRLADEFDASPEGFEIDCRAISRDIGLGPRMDRNGAFARTLERCCKFNMMQVDGPLLHVRRQIPRLGHRQIGKLSSRLQILHHTWTIDPADDGAQRRTELVRAAHLARTLLALGESTHEAEKQLHKWHFHPSIAWHAVQWAQTGPEQLP